MLDLQENVASCCRTLLTRHMDGPPLERSCSNVNGCNPCHICKPDSDMAIFARNALLKPIPIQAKATFVAASAILPVAPQRSLTPYASSDFTPAMAAAMDAAEAHFSGHNSGVKSSVSTPVAGPSRYILFISVNSIPLTNRCVPVSPCPRQQLPTKQRLQLSITSP